MGTHRWVCASCGRHHCSEEQVCLTCGHERGGYVKAQTNSPPANTETTMHAPTCALLTMPRAGVRDPRAWCSYVIEHGETLAALVTLLRVILEEQEPDLDPDGEHARLWASVSEAVAADLAVAGYVVSRVVARLGVVGLDVGCNECGAPAAARCEWCHAPLCDGHLAYARVGARTVPLCGSCCDDNRRMWEQTQGGEQ